MPTNIQAILFDVEQYSADQVNKWLKRHEYKPIKAIHTTKKYHRVRIKEPNANMRKRTITLGKGIKAIIQMK